MGSAERNRGFFGPDWPAAWKQAAGLLLFSVLLAGVLWGMRSERLSLLAERELYELEVPVPVVEIARALELYDEGDCLFVDIRPDDERGGETIPGALRIRAARFDDDLYELADFVYPEDPILLFGTGDLTGPVHVADLMLSRDFENVRILRGSVAAWRSAGGEISAVTEETP